MTSLERLLERYPVTIKIKDKGVAVPGRSMGKRPMHHYVVKLSFEGRDLETDFWMGLGHRRSPTITDVLSSLLSDYTADTRSFEDYCSEFGCDTDSRSAEQTFKALRAMKPKLRKLLGSKLDTFLEAEH